MTIKIFKLTTTTMMMTLVMMMMLALVSLSDQRTLWLKKKWN